MGDTFGTDLGRCSVLAWGSGQGSEDGGGKGPMAMTQSILTYGINSIWVTYKPEFLLTVRLEYVEYLEKLEW